MNAKLNVWNAKEEYLVYCQAMKKALPQSDNEPSLDNFAIWLQGEWPRFIEAEGRPCFSAKILADKSNEKEKKRKPKFALDFVGFSDFGISVDATLVINPEYTITGVTEMQFSEDSVRSITLIFSKRKPKLGRRGYSLKQEWEQKPQTVREKQRGEQK